jgi:hypothetical protein
MFSGALFDSAGEDAISDCLGAIIASEAFVKFP